MTCILSQFAVGSLCKAEWERSCEWVVENFGHIKDGGFTEKQEELFNAWRAVGREKELKREKRIMEDSEREREEARHRQMLVQQRERPVWSDWDILGVSEAQMYKLLTAGPAAWYEHEPVGSNRFSTRGLLGDSQAQMCRRLTAKPATWCKHEPVSLNRLAGLVFCSANKKSSFVAESFGMLSTWLV